MNAPLTLLTPRAQLLKQRWQSLCSTQPDLPTQEAAQVLGVSEAQLLATRCGEDVIRLQLEQGDLLAQLTQLGRVLMLTRSAHVIHEVQTYYPALRKGVLGCEIAAQSADVHLQMNLGQWAYAFAVQEGWRLSLQFFSHQGSALHKIYLLDESDRFAFNNLVAAYEHPQQVARLSVLPPLSVEQFLSDVEVDESAWVQCWQQLQSVEELELRISEFGLTRQQALRLAPRDGAYQVASGRVRQIIQQAASQGLLVQLWGGNSAVMQGFVGRLPMPVVQGAWLSLLTPNCHIQLHELGIDQAWVVRVPTAQGRVTLLECFDSQENLMLRCTAQDQAQADAWCQLLYPYQ